MARKKAHKGEISDLHSHTIEVNRTKWSQYDWSKMGEEWGPEEFKDSRWKSNFEWKQAVVDSLINRFFAKESAIMEIGPGAGKWTVALIPKAEELFLVDISQKCLDICKQRFSSENAHISYCLVDSSVNLSCARDNSIDYIWSYDVFVHINPTDIKKYMVEFARVLKPGGIAIIHHAGEYSSEQEAIAGFRAIMTTGAFHAIVENVGLNIIEQNAELPHKRGDVITVFQKSKT